MTQSDVRFVPVKRVRSLDGIRGIAILSVCIGHLFGEKLGLRSGTWSPLGSLGSLGVEIFFVLSGFLITGIIVRERQRTGRIDLWAFYVRRTLRIWPAYFFFVGTVATLSAIGIFEVTWSEVLFATLFLSDYFPGESWWLAHTWSLSVEEQFYLIWPIVVVALPPLRAMWIGFSALLLVIPVRILTYAFASQSVREELWHHFHVRADSLLLGSALAILLAVRPDMWTRLAEIVHRLKLHLVGIAVLIVSLILTDVLGARWQLTIGFGIENIAIGIILVRAMTPKSRTSVWLGWSPLASVGVVSFSLYLWQQLFLAPDSGLPVLLSVALSAATALASYFLVERTFIRLKESFSSHRNLSDNSRESGQTS